MRINIENEIILRISLKFFEYVEDRKATKFSKQSVSERRLYSVKN